MLAALGLVAAGCTGKACLKVALDSGDPGVTEGTTATVCLLFVQTADTGTTGGSASTSGSGGSGASGGSAGDTGAARAGTRAAVLERLTLEDVLPADVVERLQRRD